MDRLRNKWTVGRVVRNIVILIITLFILYPVLYCVAYSLSSQAAVMTKNITFFPIDITFENYQRVFKQNNIVNSFFISIARTVCGALGTLTVTGLAAYAISKERLPGKRWISIVLIIPMYIAGGMIPTYVWMFKLGLVNNFWVFVVPNMFWAFNMLLMRTYFQTIPESLNESAKLDGAGELTIFTRIVLPLSKPIIAVIAMYSGVWQWNAWYDSMVYITSNKLKPLQAIVQELIKSASTSMMQMSQSGGQAATQMGSTEGIRMATLVVTALPIICVYPFFQKYFVQGTMIGAVKQ